ncbi:MAG: preprotein translocase subunit SecY [Patescibacteria group bacterium]
MFRYLHQLWHSRDLRNKILFTVGILLLFRLATQITLPGVNLDSVKSIFARNSVLGIFSALTGGSAENFSIILMGVSPYINASIIVQLLAVIIPKWENLSKEGEQGRKTLNKYTRWLTLPLALLQSYGMILLLNSFAQVPIIDDITNPMVLFPAMLTITAGTVLLMWLGEMISERGIGNGVSMIIFAGIIANIPQLFGQSLFLASQDIKKAIPLTASVLFFIILLIIIVLVNEGQRRIPITYAGHQFQGKGANSFIPIRLVQAGMIPIIFAVSLVSFPGIVGQFLSNSASERLRNIGGVLNTTFQPNSALYLILYFLFIIAFTYFYVSITFNPVNVAENIQKRGGYIPGIRPGSQTAEYIGTVSNRLNLFGGTFLAIIALLPIIIGAYLPSSGGFFSLISGASMIIVVGVILDLIRQVNAQMLMHDYEKLS